LDFWEAVPQESPVMDLRESGDNQRSALLRQNACSKSRSTMITGFWLFCLRKRERIQQKRVRKK